MDKADFNIYFANACLNIEFSYFTYLGNKETIPIFYKNPFLNKLTEKNFYNPKIVDYPKESFTIQ